MRSSLILPGLLAALALTGAPVIAQTAAPGPVTATPLAPPPAVTAPAVTAPVATNLPKALTDLGITSATLRSGKRDMQRAEGTLPGGTAFVAALDDGGALRMLRSADPAVALPAPIVERLVPVPVRASAVFGELTTVSAVMTGPKGVMVAGQGRDGQPVRAGFAVDGTLLTFGRGEEAQMKHRHGKGDEDGEGRKGKHGRKGEKGDGPRAGDPAGAGPGEGARAALRRAGYSEIGPLARNGGEMTVEARNPEGEAVTLTVTPTGEILRETAR